MMLILLALAIGAASALTYLLRKKWIDAALALVAALALAGLLADVPAPDEKAQLVTLKSDVVNPQIGDAQVIRLEGDGLRAAQWHDLPARRLAWRAPKSDVLRLDFARVASAGRMFRLSATMEKAAARRLELLAENGQLMAEANGKGKALTVEWLPPVAETLLLKARLLDAAGKVIAEGPVPVQVRHAQPLLVKGRFSSPSFDARVLNTLLTASNAVLDWEVTLGKTVTRGETARAPMATPDMLVVDAAYFERLSGTARGALLAKVAGGASLMVLGANAGDAASWMRNVALPLKDQGETSDSGAPLKLLGARFNPSAAQAGPWRSAGDRVWIRPWEKGRIIWLGVSEWHRYAISDARALGMWWQDVLDNAGVRRAEDVSWLAPEELPLPGQRVEICALGVKGKVTFPQLKQTLDWQRRPDKADAACVAVWPAQPGWLVMQSEGAAPAQMYVYAERDWPLWQAAQRRDATARYAARTPVKVTASPKMLPEWPFALLFAAAMLLLWWRERR